MGNKIAAQPLLIKLQKDPIVQRAISHPFKTYGRIGSITFGLTFVSNCISAILSKECREVMVESPGWISVTLLAKSAFYGILWPSFYIGLLTRPKNVLCLERTFDE